MSFWDVNPFLLFGVINNIFSIDEEDGGAADSNDITVIDIVDSFRLKEIELDKKGWTAYIKGIFIRHIYLA